jgi:hypothetical protein
VYFPSGRLQPLLGRFSELILQQEVKPGSVDVVLLDAGCSSMQMDQAQRGFSLSRDGPLDMRMDGDRQVLPTEANQMKNWFLIESGNLKEFWHAHEGQLQLLRPGCRWRHCLKLCK